MKSIYIVLLIALGLIVYFVTQFSAVYPPLKKYEFNVSASNLRLVMIQTFNKSEIFEYQFTDTVGCEQNGYAYYVTLRIKGRSIDNLYSFKFYEEKIVLDHTVFAKIDLISAFDNIHNKGGYKLGDIEKTDLINAFEAEFIHNIEFHLKQK